jgi:hypothetical protein
MSIYLKSRLVFGSKKEGNNFDKIQSLEN